MLLCFRRLDICRAVHRPVLPARGGTGLHAGVTCRRRVEITRLHHLQGFDEGGSTPLTTMNCFVTSHGRTVMYWTVIERITQSRAVPAQTIGSSTSSIS